MSFRSISENLNAYREEAGSHPVALDRVLGFTFIRAWVYLMFVGAGALVGMKTSLRHFIGCTVC